MSAARRDIAPFLQRVRTILLGRDHKIALRFEDGLADRTQPPPEVPGGPSHIISANYYCTRDGRREVKPPINVVQQTLIQADKKGQPQQSSNKLPTPGPVYRWD